MITDVILRHPKERVSKCSLQPLVQRDDLRFYKAREGFAFDATGYLVLGLDGPSFSENDYGRPLLLLDSTWRLLPALQRCLTGTIEIRTLPAVQTAYPRISKISNDPSPGLASVEALYLARLLVGRPDPTLLDNYRWKEAFLRNLSVNPVTEPPFLAAE